jgi:hypothetical protein
LFEQGKFDECIELCNQAVDVGREQRADYALIAKSRFLAFQWISISSGHSRVSGMRI